LDWWWSFSKRTDAESNSPTAAWSRDEKISSEHKSGLGPKIFGYAFDTEIGYIELVIESFIVCIATNHG
jgi:hypothetical protein